MVAQNWGCLTMKILIENATIFTMNRSKPVILNGFIYIDKGKVIAVDEGAPPPELEFAEYVIDGRGRIVIPGFVMGIGDVVMHAFRYLVRSNEKKLREILSSLTKDEIVGIVEVALTSLAMQGVTSIASIVRDELLPIVVRAASETWIRVRSILKDVNVQEYGSRIKSALKNVTESDAVTKGIVTFGYYARIREGIGKELEDVEDVLYLTLDRVDLIPTRILEKIVCLDCSEAVQQVIHRNAVIDDYKRWKAGQALVFSSARFLNPRLYLYEVSKYNLAAFDELALATVWNSSNLRIGMDSVEIGKPADIVILNFREPPGGPLPADIQGIAEAIASGEYMVETVIIGGEIVIDRGEPLMVGSSLFKRVERICESLRQKA